MSAAFDVVRHPRARRVTLRFDAVTGRARLTVPRRASLARALAWAEAQRGWIEDQRQRTPGARPFVDGAVLPVNGESLTLRWRADAARGVRREGELLVVGGAIESMPRRLERWLRAEALRLLAEDTARYAARAGVTVGEVRVGDARRRWGSCSAMGAIRYSWRLLLAPPAVRRATAAHEVAHRVHMHHGPAFHALVAELYGRDPAAERAWLRDHGAALHWFGREGSGREPAPSRDAARSIASAS